MFDTQTWQYETVGMEFHFSRNGRPTAFFRLKTHPLNNKCNIDVRALDGICSFDGFHFYNVHSYYDVRSQEEPVWRRGLFQYINFN